MIVSRVKADGTVQYAKRVRRTSNDTRCILWNSERETALRMTEAEAQALVEWLRRCEPGPIYEVQHAD